MLNNIRKRLQKKNQEIVKLLNKRAQLSIEAGETKRAQGGEIYDPSQESNVYKDIKEINAGPLSDKALKDIFREIISSSRALQEPTTVAFLRPEASLCYLAAESYFGKGALYYSQALISDIFDEVESGRISWGVVPVENSLEGYIKTTMDKLISTPLNIRGEIFYGISHCLISISAKTEEIKRVYLHPRALAQCKGWLAKTLPYATLIETDSAAAAVERAREDREGATIGSHMTASANGLKIIVGGIEDNPSNTMRFLVLGNGESKMTGNDKTSILFTIPHTCCAPHHVLEILVKAHLKITRLELHPLKDWTGENLFFVDFVGHRDDDKTKKCLADVKGVTNRLKVLGSYPAGDEP